MVCILPVPKFPDVMPIFLKFVHHSLVIGCCLAFSSLIHAQVTQIVAEPIAIHTGAVGDSNLEGFTTFGIYAELTSSTDYLTAVFGSAEFPLNISTSTSFWQHGAGGNFATDLNSFFLGMLPELAFDSWLTIGLTQAPSGAGEEGIGSIGLTSALAAFGAGNDLELSTMSGGSWYALPGSSNGYPDENLRVLLAQVTTDGLISGTLNLQVFIEGNSFNEQLEAFSFGAGLLGCTDADACNYNPSATSNDGSCVGPEPYLNCDGECTMDADGDGICDEFEVLGCTDDSACDYDSEATDSGACSYAAEGLDCAGTCLEDADGDGICDALEVTGCTNSEACNYDALATDEDGSCVFADLYLLCDASCINDQDGDGVCDELEVPGCVDVNADNYNSLATDSDGTCLYEGCMDSLACNFDATANAEGNCEYAGEGLDCEGGCLSDEDGDGICDGDEIWGCVDPLADNYNSDATEDDGNCVVQPTAYCGAGTVWDEVSGQCVAMVTSDGGVGGYGTPCFGDFDGDGNIGAAELLLFLGVYDTNCQPE
jgi:hypothetical protein